MKDEVGGGRYRMLIRKWSILTIRWREELKEEWGQRANRENGDELLSILIPAGGFAHTVLIVLHFNSPV